MSSVLLPTPNLHVEKKELQGVEQGCFVLNHFEEAQGSK